MLHSHLVLGRFRLKLLNNTSIVFLVIYMYVLSDLRSNTDEDASRNVYQKCFSLSIYIYILYIYIYIYILVLR